MLPSRYSPDMEFAAEGEMEPLKLFAEEVVFRPSGMGGVLSAC